MRLNAIRCLPCRGAGPVTSSSLAAPGRKEGGPGARGHYSVHGTNLGTWGGGGANWGAGGTVARVGANHYGTCQNAD